MSIILKPLRRKRYLLVLLVGLLFLLFVKSEWIEKLMYPIEYHETIVEKAAIYELDPLLVAAIIRVETNYKVGLVSRKGALGVMQLMPDTANWIMEQTKQKQRWSMDELMNEVEPNIELGAWYIHSLLKQFDQNGAAAVAAYNAGPGNVNQWLRKQVWDGQLETAKTQIPFPETRLYVQRVFHYYSKYKSIYN